MMYIGNAFSLQMVSRDHLHRVRITPCAAPVKDGIEWTSCVGHADTAEILGVPMNRISVTLMPGDVLFVAQLVGGRLPEGTKTLPEGFRFEWVMVEVRAKHFQKDHPAFRGV